MAESSLPEILEATWRELDDELPARAPAVVDSAAQLMQRLPHIARILPWVVGGALVLAILLTVHRVVEGHPWNDPRLAPAAALLRGYSLYHPIGEGPLLGHIYGPFSAFFYTVAVALAPTPAAAAWLGSSLSVMIFFFPALWLLKLDRGVDTTAALGAFTCFWFLVLQSPVFVVPAFNVHADAPALGFGALACACLLAGHGARRTTSLVAAAALMVLSVGSKQAMVAMPLAAMLYIWMCDGRQRAVHVVGLAGGLGTVALLAITPLTADLPTLLYTTVAIPLQHPWRGAGGLSALVPPMRDLARHAMPALCVLGAVCASDVLAERLHLRRWRESLRDNGWVLLACVGLINIPASLAGRAKIGGDVNALSFTTYFLLIATAMAAARLASLGRDTPPRGWPAARLGLVVMLTLLAGRSLPDVMQAGKIPHLVNGNPERAAFEFIRSNSDPVYYPYNPLVSLMHDGGAHHFSIGMYFRELAGERISPEHIRGWLPRRPRVVAFPSGFARRYEEYTLGFLPNSYRLVEVPELPGWRVWVRD